MSSKTQQALDKNAEAIRGYDTNPQAMWARTQTAWEETNMLSGSSPFYYPDDTGMPMLPYSDLSVMGELDDADALLTLTIEASNAAGLWKDITHSFQDDNATLPPVSAGASISNGAGNPMVFAISKARLNYDRVRFKLVVAGDTNSVDVKHRKAAF